MHSRRKTNYNINVYNIKSIKYGNLRQHWTGFLYLNPTLSQYLGGKIEIWTISLFLTDCSLVSP